MWAGPGEMAEQLKVLVAKPVDLPVWELFKLSSDLHTHTAVPSLRCYAQFFIWVLGSELVLVQREFCQLSHTSSLCFFLFFFLFFFGHRVLGPES